jgi:hypothetical protein
MRNWLAGLLGQQSRFTACLDRDFWRAFIDALYATNCRYWGFPLSMKKSFWYRTRIPGQRYDMLVASRILLELKTIEAIAPIHQAQLLSYLKATGLRLGFLINFKVLVLKEGIKRLVR